MSDAIEEAYGRLVTTDLHGGPTPLQHPPRHVPGREDPAPGRRGVPLSDPCAQRERGPERDRTDGRCRGAVPEQLRRRAVTRAARRGTMRPGTPALRER